MSPQAPPDRPAIPEVLRIHHVGIVVRDAEAAADAYQRGLDLEVLAIEDFRTEARVVFLRAGETLLHLIQPLRADTPYAAALRERGEGAHHLALGVADLRAAISALAASGVGVLGDPRRDAGDVMAVFLDPAATGGTLIELVQQIRV